MLQRLKNFRISLRSVWSKTKFFVHTWKNTVRLLWNSSQQADFCKWRRRSLHSIKWSIPQAFSLWKTLWPTRLPTSIAGQVFPNIMERSMHIHILGPVLLEKEILHKRTTINGDRPLYIDHRSHKQKLFSRWTRYTPHEKCSESILYGDCIPHIGRPCTTYYRSANYIYYEETSMHVIDKP